MTLRFAFIAPSGQGPGNCFPCVIQERVANCSVTDSGSSLEQSPLHRGPNVELRYAV